MVKSILSFLLFIFLIYRVECVEFTINDVTTYNAKGVYSTGVRCDIPMSIIINVTTPGISLSGLEIIVSPDVPVNPSYYNLIFKQDQTYYYHIYVITQVGDSSIVLKLNFNNTQSILYDFFDYTCQDVPEFWNINVVNKEPYTFYGIGLITNYRLDLNFTNYLDRYTTPENLTVNCTTRGITCSISLLGSKRGMAQIVFSINQNFTGGVDEFPAYISSGRGSTLVKIPNPFGTFNSGPVSFSNSQLPATYVSNGVYYLVFKLFQYDPNKQFEIVHSTNQILSSLVASEGVPGNCTLIGGASSAANFSKIFTIDSSGVHDTGITIQSNFGLKYENPILYGPWDLSFTTVQLNMVFDDSKYSTNEISAKSDKIYTDFLITGYDDTQSTLVYPFGIIGRYNETVFKKQFTVITSNYIGSMKFKLDNVEFASPFIPSPYFPDMQKPEIVSFSISSYNGATRVAKIHVVDNGGSGMLYLYFEGIKVEFSSLVFGNYTNGIYEIPFAFGNFVSYYYKNSYAAYISDNALNIINFQNFYSLNPLKYFVEPTIENGSELSQSNVTQLYFSVPYGVVIDTTNKPVNVSLYIKTSGKASEPPYLSFTKTYQNGRIALLKSFKSSVIYQGYWNASISMYQIDFTIGANHFTTSHKPYTIIWERITIQSNSLVQQNKNASLSVYSMYADTMGPMIINMTKIATVDSGGNEITIDDNSGDVPVGWRFYIQDYNGFENGTITVSSRELTIERVFKLDKSQGPHFEISIKFTPKCISQKLYISSVILQDKYGYISTTVLDNIAAIQRVNPLLFINGSEPLELNLICPRETENDPATAIGPILNTFDFNPKELDVGKQDRLIKFEFSIWNIDSTLLPVLYLGVLNFEYQSVECVVKNVSSDGTLVWYESSIVLDYGYGYQGRRILVSLYGLYDVWGNVKGYSSTMLKNENFPHLISVPSFTLNVPIIKSVSEVYSYGGILSIFGNGFGVDGKDSIVQVDYSDGLGYNTLAHHFNSGAYKVVRIRPTDYSFNIRVVNIESNTASTVTVNPINSIERPPITPPPTNPPISTKCLGTPECSSNGYCNPSTITCICYSPWFGPDCSSKIIIIPPPIIDQSKPIINITLGSGGSGNTNSSTESSIEYQENELLTSLINVVSLREVNIGNEIIDQYIFDQWIFSNVTSEVDDSNLNYLYTHTIVPTGSDSEFNCTVNVLVQWFKKESNVMFANSNLTIPESSIKYNINITHWPFKSNLNTLQLVMLVSIQSSITTDTCSSKQFGIADEINQYLKLSVNKKSIYGIFINRGIIDSRIVDIRNTVLDSLLNETTKLKNDPSTSSSYVAVNIPNFRGIAQLDPSFSVLVDSKDNTDNSICTLTESGLTTAQIAGIVVGCVVGASILIAATIFILKTTRGRIVLRAIKLNKL